MDEGLAPIRGRAPLDEASCLRLRELSELAQSSSVDVKLIKSKSRLWVKRTGDQFWKLGTAEVEGVEVDGRLSPFSTLAEVAFESSDVKVRVYHREVYRLHQSLQHGRLGKLPKPALPEDPAWLIAPSTFRVYVERLVEEGDCVWEEHVKQDSDAKVDSHAAAVAEAESAVYSPAERAVSLIEHRITSGNNSKHCEPAPESATVRCHAEFICWADSKTAGGSGGCGRRFKKNTLQLERWGNSFVVRLSEEAQMGQGGWCSARARRMSTLNVYPARMWRRPTWGRVLSRCWMMYKAP